MCQALISAAHKSSGKTTLTLGLAAVMRHRGLEVQPFKKGPDYIDPMWLSQAAGRPCHTLDFYTSDEREVLQTVARRAGGADIALIEGNKGLYDGLDMRGSNSNAALAKLLGSPVVLVLDTQGVIRGVAPLLIGYQAFDPQVHIAGVILNRVAGARHEGKLRAVIEHYTDIPVLGAVRRDPRLQLEERHLGLMPSNEDDQARHKIGQIADAVAEQVDLAAVLAIARQAPLPDVPLPAPQPQDDGAPVRIAVARDAVFGFYYPGDLEALERCGATLVDLDTLHDPDLPHVDGLFIGGGFPETQMERLEANAGLRRGIRSAIRAGLPTYAECGGLMYLSRSLRWGERRCEMVGAIEADTVMHDAPQGRGYVRLEETGRSPWAAYAQPGEVLEIAAHEFHYSALENLATDTRYAYRMRRGSGIDGRHDGIVQHNLLACYAHLRDTGRYHWARRFVAFVRHCARAQAPRDGGADPSPQRDSEP
jgi:cobyrinic acid a,c-diamide synthase